MLHIPTTRKDLLSPANPAGGPVIERCGIALGSNVGDRLGWLKKAAKALEVIADFSQPVLRAPVYETEPEGCAPGTPSFYNTVVEIGFYGGALLLLERLQRIEQAFGRPAEREKNEPRTLDLDLLYAGRTVLHTPELELPHPRLASRRFVLQPLAEIAPALVLPGQSLSIAALRDALPAASAPLTLVTSSW